MSRQARLRRDTRPTRLSVEPLEERRLLAVMSFQDGVLPTPDYAGTRDVPLFGADESMNFGDATTLRADAEQGSTGEPVWSLMKWDLSGIPATATINDVSITVNVSNTTVAPGFSLLAMRTAWIESEATWIGPTSTSTWEEPGVTDPSDFDPTVLGTMIGTATGPLTVLLNSAGRAVVAGWLADPASNHGLLISNAANDNSLRFDSREGTTATNRPKLSIDFTFNDVDPPTATLIDPLDNGPADQDDDAGEVLVGVRDTFVIGLDDFALDDATVTAETLSITKDAAAFTEFTFAFDAAADQITLAPTAGSFAEGSYNVTLNGGVAKIADATGNILPRTVLAIVIDAGLPTTPVAEDDAYETAEDTPLVADPESGVLDNDFGGNAPGDAVLVTGPTNGTLALNPDGSFTYTPVDDFHGQDSFTYTLATPLFTSNVATATITVTSVPDPPIARDDEYRTPTETQLEVRASAGVLVNDTSVEGGALSARVDVGPQHGTLELTAGGSLSYTPQAGFSGADVFTYIASDGATDSIPASVTIIVNDPPTTEPDEYQVDQGGVLTVPVDIGVLSNDSDAAADTLTAELVSGPSSGELVLNPDGSLTYTPQPEFLGTDSFTYRAVDPFGASTSATVTINVVGLAPVARSNKYNALEDELLVVDAASGVLANDSDPQGDEMTAVLVRDVREGTLTLNPDGSFTYQPNENFVGPDSFRYRASDGEHESASTLVQITVENVNDPPVAVDDSYIAFLDEPLSTAETGGGDLFTDVFFDDFESSVSSQWSRNTTGVTPIGSRTYLGDFHGEAVTLSLDGLPIHEQVAVEFDLYLIDTWDGSTRSFGPDIWTLRTNDGVTLLNTTFSNLPQFGDQFQAYPDSYPGGNHRPMTGAVESNTLGFPQSSVYHLSFTFAHQTASVGFEFSSSQIRPLDERWGIDNVSVRTVEKQFSVLVNDTDLEGDAVEAILVDDVRNGTLELADDGSFTYTPDEGFIGFDGFTYVASDGESASNVATVTIKVNAPPVVEDDAYDVVEDNVLVVDAATGVLANDTDPNGDALRAVLVSGPAHGSVELADDGSFTYTPDENFFGEDIFTYRASDGHSTSEDTTVVIGVDSVNDTPLVADDLYVIQEETSHTIVGHVNDGSINKFGSTNIQADSMVPVSRVGRSGLPRANRVAVYFFELPNLSPSETIDASNLSFNYVARDDDGIFGPPPFSVDLYGLGWVSGPPQLNVDWFWESRDDDARTGDELETNIGNNSVTKLQDNIITNPRAGAPVGTPVGRVETDGSGDGELTDFLRSLYEQGASGGDFAVLRLSHDIQIITGNLNGYRVSLADDLGNEPVLSIQTRRDLDSPLGGVLIVAAPTGVLHNDRDVESDPMTAVLIDDPTSGVVQLNDDGSFTYTTHSRFAGIDQFTYRASDGRDLSNVATVTIEVGPQSEAILAGDDAYSVAQGETLSVSGNVIAESGLNDAAGIGSDDVAGSPYTIGESVHLRGATEPGWNGETWRVSVGGGDFGHDRARVVTSQVVEGDAAMFVDGASLGTWVHRRLPAAQSGRFSIEQHVRFTDLAGSFTSRPFGASATSEEIGPQWTAENGKILVRDGDGAGGGAMLDTGFRWQPGEWHRVSLVIDVAAQTYQLSFDGQKYESPEPLGFRGSPTFIGAIDYLSDKDAWIDRVRILSLDELPSVLENDANAAGDRLEAILVDGPRHGDLTLNADGTFVYTPLAGLAASDAFTYRATNGTWVSNLATVRIDIESSLPADLTGNGFVDFEDLTVLLANWNQNVSAAQGNLVNPGGSPVNFEDLTVLLAAWTGPGGAAAPQAAVVGSDRLQPVDQNRMNPVTTNVGPGFESDSELDAPRQAATHGSATGVASYRVRRDALRSRPTRRIGRLQAAAVDRAMEEEAMFERRERIFSRRTRRG